MNTPRPVTGPDGDNPITDEMLVALRAAVFKEPVGEDRDRLMAATFIALDRRFSDDRRQAARAECWTGWQARPGIPKPLTDAQLRIMRDDPDTAEGLRWDCRIALGEIKAKRSSATRFSARIRCAAAYNVRQEAAEHALLGDLDAGSPEPFCACGRRWSQCDRSRRGCSATRHAGKDGR